MIWEKFQTLFKTLLDLIFCKIFDKLCMHLHTHTIINQNKLNCNLYFRNYSNPIKKSLASKSHVWCPNMTNYTSLESSTFRICIKKLKICKMFAKNSVQKKLKIHFEKPLSMPFKYAKNVCKILDNLMCD